MRILVNDFGGYPFPVQLSKYLASDNYQIAHTYVSNIKTPHGNMENKERQGNLVIIPILLSTEFKKYSFFGRFKGEYEFARKVAMVMDSFKPDILLSANTPLLAQSILLKKCKQSDIKFIYWCQDIHSIALAGYLKKRLPFLAKFANIYFKRKEIRLLEQSSYVITIAKSFNEVFENWGISQKNISVIHNWGPINEISVKPKANPWSVKMGVEAKLVILYSGTLGLKHNPKLISDAAKFFLGSQEIEFIVISEGIGAEILKQQKAAFKLNNLMVLPYQKYNILSDVLGSADILLSILEKEAAIFSVPSKVLTYLCAQKPILLCVPKDNLSVQIVADTISGFYAEPDDTEGFITKIKELIENPDIRKTMGSNGRRFAEENFEISSIGYKFIEIFNHLLINQQIVSSNNNL